MLPKFIKIRVVLKKAQLANGNQSKWLTNQQLNNGTKVEKYLPNQSNGINLHLLKYHNKHIHSHILIFVLTYYLYTSMYMQACVYIHTFIKLFSGQQK